MLWCFRTTHCRRCIKPRLYVLILLSYCFCFTLHIIYTAPGQANAYMYWLQNVLQESEQIDISYNVSGPVTPFVPSNFRLQEHAICPERFPEMSGRVPINMSEVAMTQINRDLAKNMSFGGVSTPGECRARWNIAILIPFRNRDRHLPILLRHLIPLLLAQHLKFAIFIVHQAGGLLFNRAMLLNVGFVEARKRDHFDCFIFHDVDLIPENNRNYYGCSGMPRRMREKLDIYGYRLEYPEFFGGVSGVTAEQFERVNGYSNQYWGWGGEDDDLYTRIKLGGYNISTPPEDYGRYRSITLHHNQERQGLRRFSLLKHIEERNFIDGLNSLRYPRPVVTKYPLYTNVSVHIHQVDNLPVQQVKGDST